MRKRQSQRGSDGMRKKDSMRERSCEREKDRLINMHWRFLPTPSTFLPLPSCWHCARYFGDRQTGSSQRQVPLLPLYVSLPLSLSIFLIRSRSLPIACPKGCHLSNCQIAQSTRVCVGKGQKCAQTAAEGEWQG